MPDETMIVKEMTAEQCYLHLLGKIQDMQTSHRIYEEDKAVLEQLTSLAIPAPKPDPDPE